MDRASKGTFLLFASQGILLAISFFLNGFLGRSLGPADFGAFGIILLINLTLVTLLSAGISAESTRLIAANPSKAKEINQEATKHLVILSIATALIVYFSSSFIANLLGNKNLAGLLQFSTILIPLQTLFSQQTAFVNGLQEFKKQALGNVVFAVSKAVFAVILLVIGYNLFGAILAYALAPVIGYLFLFKKPVEKKYAFNYSNLLAFAVPYSLSAVALSLMNNIDLLFVQTLIQNAGTTGQYLAASNISRLFPTIFGIAGVVLFPIIAKQKNNSRKYLKLFSKYFSLIIIPVLFFLAAASYNFITAIYSETYVQATTFFPMLMASAVLASITFTLFAVLNALGKTKTTLYLTALAIITQVSLLYALISSNSAMGAAYAMLASNTVITLITFLLVTKKIGSFVDYKTLAKTILIGAVVTVLIFLTNPLLSSKWLILIQIPAAFLLFFYSCIKLGVIKKEDKNFIKTALPSRTAFLVDWFF
ncbi:MAG: oligosaccharide flippase family protein [Candidatus Micrarchaeota archaeon]